MVIKYFVPHIYLFLSYPLKFKIIYIWRSIGMKSLGLNVFEALYLMQYLSRGFRTRGLKFHKYGKNQNLRTAFSLSIEFVY